MKFPLILHAQILYRRTDAVLLTAWILVTAALLVGAIALPRIERARDVARAEYTRLNRHSDGKASATGIAQPNHLLAFRSVLGAREDAEQYIASVLAMAQGKQLAVRKADYRSAYNKAGQYYTYQMTVPLHGPYAAVRAFCDEVLNRLPFAALDSVQFSRAGIDMPDVDAKVDITFYLKATRGSAALPGNSSAGSTGHGALN